MDPCLASKRTASLRREPKGRESLAGCIQVMKSEAHMVRCGSAPRPGNRKLPAIEVDRGLAKHEPRSRNLTENSRSGDLHEPNGLKHCHEPRNIRRRNMNAHVVESTEVGRQRCRYLKFVPYDPPKGEMRFSLLRKKRSKAYKLVGASSPLGNNVQGDVEDLFASVARKSLPGHPHHRLVLCCTPKVWDRDVVA